MEEGDSLQLELMMIETGMIDVGDDSVSILPVSSGVGSRKSTIFLGGSKNQVKKHINRININVLDAVL